MSQETTPRIGSGSDGGTESIMSMLGSTERPSFLGTTSSDDDTGPPFISGVVLGSAQGTQHPTRPSSPSSELTDSDTDSVPYLGDMQGSSVSPVADTQEAFASTPPASPTVSARRGMPNPASKKHRWGKTNRPPKNPLARDAAKAAKMTQRAERAQTRHDLREKILSNRAVGPGLLAIMGYVRSGDVKLKTDPEHFRGTKLLQSRRRISRAGRAIARATKLVQVSGATAAPIYMTLQVAEHAPDTPIENWTQFGVGGLFAVTALQVAEQFRAQRPERLRVRDARRAVVAAARSRLAAEQAELTAQATMHAQAAAGVGKVRAARVAS